MKPVLNNIMNTIDNVLLKSKFRGCMLGALVGDCYGAPFEGETMTRGQKLVLQNYFDKLQGPAFEAPEKQYTDDTAMMKSVAKCLIDKPAVDFKFMAKLFIQEYFNEPRRGYGQNVVEVFHKLRRNKFEDIYRPAKEQFSGSGSYGNGGAMRIAPIALYFFNNYDGMIDAATKATQITHSNELGVNGALLQCIAVQQCLLTDPAEKINPEDFTSKLIDKMKTIEVDDGIDASDTTPYQNQLKLMEKLLSTKYHEEYDDDVIKLLGNSISALHSVPTAIFCFLKAQEEIPGIKTENLFRRTIQYAISLGGDTDTIACMAGALAGAYIGEDSIEKNLLNHCEFYKEMLALSDNLFAVIDFYDKKE